MNRTSKSTFGLKESAKGNLEGVCSSVRAADVVGECVVRPNEWQVLLVAEDIPSLQLLKAACKAPEHDKTCLVHRLEA